MGVAIAALWFGLKERSARHDAERAVDESHRQRAWLDGELRQAARRLADVESERRRVEVSLEAARKKATAIPAEPAGKSSPVASGMAAVRSALLNDPKFQNLQLAAERVRLMGTYLPLCEQLHLTEAQREQFLAILHKRGEQKMDLDAIMEAQRSSADDPIFAKMKQQMGDECRAAQTVLLGEAGCRQFEAYERSVPAREFVNQFVSTAAGAGITAGQADALTQAMAEASVTYQGGAVVSVLTIDWAKVLAAAATTLSAQQLVLFKNTVVNIRNRTRISALVLQ